VFNSCSNDFDLVDNWKDIPIVYGLLNANDTAQYIRVEKAFLDEETSALLIAQEPDSLYYDNILVELQEINNNSAVEFTFPLTLVDANLEGYQKPEGVFADTPNYIYKTTEPLNPEHRYNVVVTNGDTDKTVTLQERNGQRSVGLIGDFVTFNLETSAFRLKFEPGGTTNFSWNSTDVNGNEYVAFYDVVLYINYFEIERDNPGSRTEKTLEWVLRRSMPHKEDGFNQTFDVEATEFYRYIDQQLEPNPLICRELGDADLVIYAGGEDLLEYINREAANSGITGTQGFADYTNLSEGLGIISTRYDKRVENIQFNSNVNDELLINEFTSDLGFLDFGDTCD